MSVKGIPVVDYKEVKDVPNHPEKVLIDVREPHELVETGVIPQSVNIPRMIIYFYYIVYWIIHIIFIILTPRIVNSVERAFSDETSSEEFKALYRIEKPSRDTYLIISCRSGRRSQIAAETIKGLGYRK